MRFPDNPRALGVIDRSGMLGLLESFPGQCRSARALGEMICLPRSLNKINYKNIVCTGMGGSAIGADIARSYLADKADIPIFVNRDYLLPRFVGRDTLVVVSSYSGNTEETTSAYRDAMARRSKIVAITSGGEIKRNALRDGNPVVLIPQGFPPRAALGYSFFTILSVFSKLGVIKGPSENINKAILSLERLRDAKIGPSVRSGRNMAKRIAGEIVGKFPVIYSAASHIDAVATRWRGQFAENAKTISTTHLFPEMNHNEIMGYKFPRKLMKSFAVIMLKDSLDHPRVARRMDITAEILRAEKVKVIEVSSVGKAILERILSLVYIGDFVSYYLAILNGVDPTSIARIDYLKRELARR